MSKNDITAGILGIEGGGTKTTWALLAPDGKILRQGEAGPGNTLLLSDAAPGKTFRGNSRDWPGANVRAIGAAFAGCQQAAEKARVEKVLRGVLAEGRAVRVMEDTRSILAAAFGDGPGIVVIAGTGSNVAGQKSLRDPIEKAGGWGHLFADRGSAYDIARRGMEARFRALTMRTEDFAAGARISRSAGKASHGGTRSLPACGTRARPPWRNWAPCVFAAAKKGDRDARRCSTRRPTRLAEKAAVVARRLGMTPARGWRWPADCSKTSRAIAEAVSTRACERRLPKAESFLLTVPGVLGAARLAGLGETRAANAGRRRTKTAKPIAEPARLAAFSAATTEQRNPRSRGLDRRSIPELVDLFIREERYVEKALAAQRAPIAQAARAGREALCAGGRLIYVGAGTSGRLGVVDASEMPPTFNAPPEQVQAIIAGGAAAVFNSQEGAEDARETARGRTPRARADEERRGLRHRGQRADAVRPRGARSSRAARCGHDSSYLQSEAVDARAGRCGDRSADRAGACHRLHAA